MTTYGHPSVTVQGRTKDVQVRRLGEDVLLRLEPDGTVVLDADLFDALVTRTVERADEMEQERHRHHEGDPL